MSDPRFYVDAELAVGEAIDLPERVAHHASHVLRLRDDAAVVVFNGRGGEYRGRLTARRGRVELLAHVPAERESPLHIALVQAWIAADKLDWVVEKAVELGVARILLFPARRSVVQLDAARRARRLERLHETVVAACCQCGRNRLPPVEAFEELGAALRAAACDGGVGLVLQPDAPLSLPAAALSGDRAFALAVGPEGGFDEPEVALAAASGYRPVRLGNRVLRTETAGLAAAAALQSVAGDFR